MNTAEKIAPRLNLTAITEVEAAKGSAGANPKTPDGSQEGDKTPDGPKDDNEGNKAPKSILAGAKTLSNGVKRVSLGMLDMPKGRTRSSEIYNWDLEVGHADFYAGANPATVGTAVSNQNKREEIKGDEARKFASRAHEVEGIKGAAIWRLS